MDNLRLPAYAVGAVEWNEANTRIRKDGPMAPWSGFTKLELASLMIAGNIGVKIDNIGVTEQQLKLISEVSVAIAKAVLEEANK